MKYPITCVLGQRGSGKTLFMTFLAYQYYLEGKKIYSNYHLKEIPYTYISFKELAELPEELNNAVVFMDEIQIGADSYEIFKRSNKMITVFATQLRKRKVTLYYSTQVFTMATKRLRQQTNFIIMCLPMKTLGFVHAEIWEYSGINTQLIKPINLDLTKFFNHYDTDEVITFSDNEIKEGIEKQFS
jgi:hypothetical protein